MRTFFWVFTVLFLGMLSCEKPEKLFPQPSVSSGLQTQTFSMGETYENQLWYSFTTQQIRTNQYGLWHIGFSCDNVPRVITNGGLNVHFSIARFGNCSFKSINRDSLRNANWQFDNPSGEIDSLAFGKCFIPNGPGKFNIVDQIFLIDLGAKIADSMRYIKLQLLGLSGGYYGFGYSYLNDTAIRFKKTLAINPQMNFVYYNFIDHKEVYDEPFINNDWDIVFTTYKKFVPDPNGVPFPYIIRGVLINPLKIEVAEVNNIPFHKIDLNFAQKVIFSKKKDEIGYDWKQYDPVSDRYTMVPNRVYLIREAGVILKLRFIDFYNDQGKKGYPKIAWEYLQ